MIAAKVFGFSGEGDRLAFGKDGGIDRIAIGRLDIDGGRGGNTIDGEGRRRFEGGGEAIDRDDQRVGSPEPLAVDAIHEEEIGGVIGDLNEGRKGGVGLPEFGSRDGLEDVEAIGDLQGIPAEGPRLLMKFCDRGEASDLTETGGLRAQKDLDGMDRLRGRDIDLDLDATGKGGLKGLEKANLEVDPRPCGIIALASRETDDRCKPSAEEKGSKKAPSP